MSFLLLAVTFACSFATARVTATPDLSGSWTLVSSYLESYSSTAVPPAGWAVTCAVGPCTAWKHANLTIVNLPTVRISFDSGVVHTGELSADTRSILWGDLSVWERPATRDFIDVHLVLHSHLDPGWLRTYYELYNISHPGINDFAVRDISSAVVRTLTANPNRTFGAELTVFWSLWYAEASAADRAALRALVANKQIEFVGGGWTQNDEAITRFEDVIDQTTLGHLWAASALGAPRPTTAYQADPFGHSTTQAAFFAASALDLATYGRPMSARWNGGGVADPVDTASAMLWHPTASSADSGYFDDATILAHDQAIGYWEPYRSTHPLLVKGDASAAADNLASFIQNLASQRPATKTILIMFGDDFEGGDFDSVLPVLESAMELLNARPPGALPKLNVHYSTPSRFVSALAAEVAASGAAGDDPIAFEPRPAWDMLPLIGCEFPAPWTGFFTSRVDFKMLFYAAGAARRSATILHALARDSTNWDADAAALLPLWAAVSLVQHHDAVTGDSFDRVEEDYKAYVVAGLGLAANVTASAVASLGSAPAGSYVCFNVSAAPCAQIFSSLAVVDGATTLTITNPSAWERSEVVEVLVPSANVVVSSSTDSGGLVAQVMAAIDVDGDPSAQFLLSFQTLVAPLGSVSIVITRVNPNAPGSATFIAPSSIDGPITIANGLVSLNFSAQGSLTSFESATMSAQLTAQLLVYYSEPGAENGWDFSTSGKPWTAATPFSSTLPQTLTLAVGPVFSEVRAQLSANAVFRVRVYAGEAHARVASIVGPFNVSSGSADAILRITTTFQNAGVWRTDSNGLERHSRMRNMRPWWPAPTVDTLEPVSSNYYPVLTAASITDVESGASLAVLPRGTAHGAASPADGVLDVSISRAVLGSGSFPALANRRVTVEDVLLLSSSEEAADEVLRPLAAKLASPVSVFAATGASARPAFAPCAAPLPPAAELVTLALLPLDSQGRIDVSAAVQGPPPVPPPPQVARSRAALPLANSTVLVRVRHIYASGEGAWAQPVDVDLSSLFGRVWNVRGAQEMTLTAAGDMASARAEQVQWPQAAGGKAAGLNHAPLTRAPHDGSALFTLLPMQVRTFLVDVEAATLPATA